MGIDRIGGKGAPPAPSGPEKAEKAGGASAPFEVDAATTRRAEGVAATSPLERLRAGEIDVRAYVELKVEEATRGLHGLRAEDLEVIRSELRQRMMADPAIADLVATATGGKVPEPAEE